MVPYVTLGVSVFSKAREGSSSSKCREGAWSGISAHSLIDAVQRGGFKTWIEMNAKMMAELGSKDRNAPGTVDSSSQVWLGNPTDAPCTAASYLSPFDPSRTMWLNIAVTEAWSVGSDVDRDEYR